MHRASYVGRGMEFPCPLQACHSPRTSTCSPTWKLSESCPFGFLMEASLYMVWLIKSLIMGNWTQPPALLPSLEVGEWEEWKFQPSNQRVFMATSPSSGYLRSFSSSKAGGETTDDSVKISNIFVFLSPSYVFLLLGDISKEQGTKTAL